jgi:hypothetical protein
MGDIPSKQSNEYIDKIPLILEENQKKGNNKKKDTVILKDKLKNNFKYKLVVYDDK